MFLCLQTSNTSNHELRSKEKVSFHLLHSCLWRLEGLGNTKLIEANTSALQLCEQYYEEKPTLLNEYDALKQSLMALNVLETGTDIKEKVLLGVESTEAHELIKGFVKKFKPMSSREKRLAIDALSENHPELEEFEGNHYREGPIEVVKALFERLICVTSMDFDISSIDINSNELINIRDIAKSMLELGYNQCGIRETIYSSENNKELLGVLSTDKNKSEALANAFMNSQLEVFPKLELALHANDLIAAYLLMSQADVVDTGVH